MSWESYKAQPIARFGSLVTNFASENMPLGVSPDARNVRYTLNTVATRYGVRKALTTNGSDKINGIGVLVRTGATPTYYPLVFDAAGSLYQEVSTDQPLTPITSTQVTLVAGTYMQMVAVYQRAYLAFGDLRTGSASPAVFNGSTLDPLSMRPIGETWAAAENYQVGECVAPSTANGHIYRCTVAGVAGTVEPVWPTGASATIVDGAVTWTEANPIFTSTGVGNICAGTRYAIVLYVNRNGYISGCTDAAVFTVTVALDGKRLQCDNIPLGPSNTAQRIVAFGMPGTTSSGPFWYIGAADVAAGISITSCVIPDNTSTSITVSFPDAFLETSTDVSNNLRKIKLPNQAHIVYNNATRRLFAFGEDDQPSLVRVSEEDDPETFYGDTGYFYVSRDDGERAITSLQWRNETYVLKERSGYILTPSEADPVEWEVSPRWSKVGPSGPRAVEGGAEFIAFAHRSGAYLYDGTAPQVVSREIDALWQQINWDYGHLISVSVDDETREVRFCIPFGSSTVPNKTLTLNYERGTDPPVRYSAFTGQEVAAPDARKWSLDDIAAMQIIRAERPLTSPNPNDPLPSEYRQSQLLVASSETGDVGVITKDDYTDYGGAINSVYETGRRAGVDSVIRCGGFSLSARGLGKLSTAITVYQGEPRQTKYIDLSMTEGRFYRVQTSMHGRQFGARFTNGNTAGAWFELFSVTLYIADKFATEFK